MYMYIHICVCIYIYVCIFVYMSMYHIVYFFIRSNDTKAPFPTIRPNHADLLHGYEKRPFMTKKLNLVVMQNFTTPQLQHNPRYHESFKAEIFHEE